MEHVLLLLSVTAQIQLTLATTAEELFLVAMEATVLMVLIVPIWKLVTVPKDGEVQCVPLLFAIPLARTAALALEETFAAVNQDLLDQLAQLSFAFPGAKMVEFA